MKIMKFFRWDCHARVLILIEGIYLDFEEETESSTRKISIKERQEHIFVL